MPKPKHFDVDQLYEQVRTTFNQYDSDKLDSLYDTKSLFLKSIHEANGDNNYVKPHKKRRN